MAGPDAFAPSSTARARLSRAALHLAGILAAGVIAWLLWQGYRQPELFLDLANVNFC